MIDRTKFLSIRIFNKTCSCVLMRKYNNGMWAVPTISVPFDSDPMDYLESILGQIEKENFELKSAINILKYTNDSEHTKVISFVYDIQYNGMIYPMLPKNCTEFVESKWMTAEMIKRENNFNIPTTAAVLCLDALFKR